MCVIQKVQSLFSFIPRPLPSFSSLAVATVEVMGKLGEGLGTRLKFIVILKSDTCNTMVDSFLIATGCPHSIFTILATTLENGYDA